MLAAAQPGPISLNDFLPRYDGPLAAWTSPEEVLLVMRKRLFTKKGEIQEIEVLLFLVFICSWSNGMVCFQGPHEFPFLRCCCGQVFWTELWVLCCPGCDLSLLLPRSLWCPLLGVVPVLSPGVVTSLRWFFQPVFFFTYISCLKLFVCSYCHKSECLLCQLIGTSSVSVFRFLKKFLNSCSEIPLCFR